MTIVGCVHKHIDNGGITVEVTYDFENGHTCINFDTSYYGYPAVNSTLTTWGSVPDGDDKFLQELGLMFLNASNRVSELYDQVLKDRGEK